MITSAMLPDLDPQGTPSPFSLPEHPCPFCGGEQKSCPAPFKIQNNCLHCSTLFHIFEYKLYYDALDSQNEYTVVNIEHLFSDWHKSSK